MIDAELCLKHITSTTSKPRRGNIKFVDAAEVYRSSGSER